MIDIHCHILPNFDDGAADLHESIAMARMAEASGVKAIVATPHFPGDAASFRRLGAMLGRFERLEQAVRQEGLKVKLFPGAEILCLPETPRLAAQKVLPTLGNSDYLLVEFNFGESAAYMDEMLESLVQAGYRPVVAHPERYRAVQGNLQLLRSWFDRGYVLQLNKGSILGAFGGRVQQTANQILADGMAHVIASDAHGTDRRTPHMGALMQWLDEHCEPEYARILTELNPARLLLGKDMAPIR